MNLDKNSVALRLEDTEKLYRLYIHLSGVGRRKVLQECKEDEKSGNTANLDVPNLLIDGEPVKAFEGVHFKEFLEELIPIESRSDFLELYGTEQRELFSNFANITRNEMSFKVPRVAFENLSIYFKTSNFQILLSFFEYCYVGHLPLRIFNRDREALKEAIDDMAAYKLFFLALQSQGVSDNEILQRWKQSQVTIDTPGSPEGLINSSLDARLATFHGKEILGRANDIESVQSFLQSSSPSMYLSGVAGIGKSEICKASLKKWLETSDSESVFFVKVSEGANAKRLLELLGKAVGLDSDVAASLQSLSVLKQHLKPALYYLDNLESIVETLEGVALLRELVQMSGIRVLASSRTDLSGILREGFLVEPLDIDSSKKLFLDNWSGIGTPDNEKLESFIIHELGKHALSIYLTASISKNKSFGDILTLWLHKGTALASLQKSRKRADRYTNLDVSFALTRDFLATEQGALELWIFLALFDSEVDKATLTHWEMVSGYEDAISILEEYSVVLNHQGSYKLLPPIARYAADCARSGLASEAGFNWLTSRSYCYNYFLQISFNSASAPSTEYGATSEKRCAEQAHAIARLFSIDASCGQPLLETPYFLHQQLEKVYEAYLSSTHCIYNVTVELFDDNLSYRMLAQHELLSGNHQRAKKFASYALDFALQNGTKSAEYANSLATNGQVDFHLKNFDGAIRQLEESSALCKEMRLTRGYCSAQINLATIFQIRGELEKAKTGFEQAAFEAGEIGDTQTRAEALAKLALLLVNKGDFKKARKYLNEAISVFHSLTRLGSMADAYLTFGKLEEKCEEFSKAIDMFDKAEECFKHVNHIEGQKIALNYNADVLKAVACNMIRQSDIQKAKEYTEKALRLSISSNDKDRANKLRVLLGNMYAHTGSPEKGAEAIYTAINYYLETNLEKGNPHCFINFAELAIKHRLTNYYAAANSTIEFLQSGYLSLDDYFGNMITSWLSLRLSAIHSESTEDEIEQLFVSGLNVINHPDSSNRDILFRYLCLTIYECLQKDEGKFVELMNKTIKTQPKISIPDEHSNLNWLVHWANVLSPRVEQNSENK